jgi:hypothetical protein
VTPSIADQLLNTISTYRDRVDYLELRLQQSEASTISFRVLNWMRLTGVSPWLGEFGLVTKGDGVLSRLMV